MKCPTCRFAFEYISWGASWCRNCGTLKIVPDGREYETRFLVPVCSRKKAKRKAKAKTKAKAKPAANAKAKPAAKRRTAAEITESVRELLSSAEVSESGPDGLTKAEVRDLLGISGAVAKRVLDNLLMAGGIVVAGEGRKARFRVLASKAHGVTAATNPGAA